MVCRRYTLNRSRTLPGATDVARDIVQIAWELFDVLAPGDRVRLVGVRMEGLARADHAPEQLTLGTRAHGWRDAERAMDTATARFGRAAIGPASLLRRPEMAGPARSEQEAMAVQTAQGAAPPPKPGETHQENRDDDNDVRLSDPRTRS